MNHEVPGRHRVLRTLGDRDMAKVKHDLTKTSLKLSEAQWTQLIDHLEKGRGPTVPATRDRRDLDVKRHRHVRRAALRVQHPTGPATSHLVRTRNLSSGGVGFIHNSFLYNGTACHIALQTRYGESVALAGMVMWCRHVAGQGHEIGLRFVQMIEIDEFIGKDSAAESAA